MEIPSSFPGLRMSIGPVAPAQPISIDDFSTVASPLEMFFGTTSLSKGTCFFWLAGKAPYLVTNWHNVTGINPLTGKHLSPTGGEPDNIEFDIWIDFSRNLRRRFNLPLNGENGPIWYQHPRGREIDVVCIPLPPELLTSIFPINAKAQHPITVRISDDVFVLGYPMGIGVDRLPIWKRASVASEPAIDADNLPKMLIDTATASGMSGSPVIRRSAGGGQMSDGSWSIMSGSATRFIGVYSGRLTGGSNLEAQLGIVWKERVIEEIITGRNIGKT